jgi:hypothetical protein
MKVADLTLGLHAQSFPVWAARLCMLALVLTPIACQNRAKPPDESGAGGPLQSVSLPATAAPASQPTGHSSVMVYIKMVIEKKYGVLAHIIGGKRDNTVRHTFYDVNHSWWDNPLIAYADPPFAHADVIGQADSEAIVGEGASANVDVLLTLVPHVNVTVRTIPKSDAIKGTITVSISTVADYFDGDWTEIVREKDKRLSFSFTTCDPSKRLQETMHEIRTVPAFSLERYTRGQEKWEPRSRWPDEFETGDARTIIYGKDAALDVTAYRYVEQ